MARPRLAVLAAALALVGAAVPAAAAADKGSPGLRSGLTQTLRGPGVSLARTAAYAVDVSSGTVLYAHNAMAPFVPASNEKLPVTWAALMTLGTDFRFRTDVYGVGRRAGRIWVGDLVLKGFGDPTLTRVDLVALATTLRQRGIRRVTGRVLGDESFFDSRRGAPGWKAGWVGLESPPLSALVVDRAAGWPALSPPLLAARTFTDTLRALRVPVGGQPGLTSTPPGAALLATVWSDDLSTLIGLANRDSDNFVAEMLLKQIGATVSESGTTAAGSAAVTKLMAAARIPVDGVRIVDGSGLSPLNRLTAAALVGVLEAGLTNPDISRPFRDSLAVAARSGTLRNRLASLGGTLRGKTGTTDLSCTLSGVIGDSVVFAVLENGTPVHFWASRAAQDRFVLRLAGVG